jgi:DNA-binding NarL/FixJ family response regulator
MRVVIAEDHVLLREGLARVLRDGGLEVAGAVGDAAALLEVAGRERPDVVVVDIRMPPSFTDEGLRAAEALLGGDQPVPVLVLSQAVEPGHAVRLLGDGRPGVGYLLKDRVADIELLLEAVRRVARGGTAIDPEVIATLVRRPRDRDVLTDLTDRERDVLALMSEGRSNRAIAASLGVGEKTVETHVARIFSKLGLEPEPDDHRRVLAVIAWLGTAR